MTRSYTIFIIRGIRVKVDLTWFITLAVFSFLQFNFFASRFPDWELQIHLAIAVSSVLLLFAFVLIHELAHSFMAQARGIPVRDITLFLLGGVSNIQTEARKALDEFAIAIVGPLTNVIFALILWGVSAAGWVTSEFWGALLGYALFANIALAIFNMIPGLPLDGGRVLRSILWGITKRMHGSAVIASTVGQGFGIIFMLLAFIAFTAAPLLQLFGLEQAAQLFSGLTRNFLNFIWIAFIGFFIFSSATGYKRYVKQRMEYERQFNSNHFPPHDE